MQGYAARLITLLKHREIHNELDLKSTASNHNFRAELSALWNDILSTEGGKLSLTIVLGTIGLALGGAGIAAGGGAIGIPLVMLLAPAGFFGGQELDSEGLTTKAIKWVQRRLGLGNTTEAQSQAQVLQLEEPFFEVLSLTTGLSAQVETLSKEIEIIRLELNRFSQASLDSRFASLENGLAKVQENQTKIKSEYDVQLVELRDKQNQLSEATHKLESFQMVLESFRVTSREQMRRMTIWSIILSVGLVLVATSLVWVLLRK